MTASSTYKESSFCNYVYSSTTIIVKFINEFDDTVNLTRIDEETSVLAITMDTSISPIKLLVCRRLRENRQHC